MVVVGSERSDEVAVGLASLGCLPQRPQTAHSSRRLSSSRYRFASGEEMYDTVAPDGLILRITSKVWHLDAFAQPICAALAFGRRAPTAERDGIVGEILRT